MKKHNQKHLEGVSYETPSVKTLDIMSEGLLCVSGDFTLGGGGSYGEGDINDNDEY